jgi:hypothetical protein
VFADYAQRWVEDRLVRERTRSINQSLLKVHILPELGTATLSGITTERVRAWNARMVRNQPTMAPKAYRLLRTILTTAVDDGLLEANPCRIRLAGTMSTQAGGTLREIQARLGHAAPDTAMIYQHVTEGRDEEIAEGIDRLIRRRPPRSKCSVSDGVSASVLRASSVAVTSAALPGVSVGRSVVTTMSVAWGDPAGG